MPISLTQPLISILVPIYEVEAYLPKCIKSLINQTYKNLEIILVNDGSPDSSAEVCEKYAKHDSRIKVIHQQNSGLVSARKAGILAATGEYIAYLDGDDWVDEVMYAQLMEVALQTGAEVVAAGHKEVLGNQVVEVLHNQLPTGLYTSSQLEQKLYPNMLYSGKFSQFGVFTYLWNKLFKKEVVLASQLDVPNKIFIGEDAACLYPALLKAKSIYITDSSNYHYVQHPKSMVKARKLNGNEIDRYNLLYSHLHQAFSTNHHSKVLNSQLEHFMLSLLTVRTGLDFYGDGEVNELFAFGKVAATSKLIICGAGTFGQNLISRIKNNTQFELVAWLDNLAEFYKKFGFDVCRLAEIQQLNFDYVLVAYVDEKNALVIKRQLEDLGVPNNKILTVNHFSTYPIQALLQKYGLELQE